MLTICLTCTKRGNVFEATTSEPVPSEAVERLGDSFVCSRCTSGPYKTIPRRRYHCTTCAVAIWPNGYEEKTIGIGGGTCCVCEREKPGKELHLVSQEHPVVTVERQRAELEALRARVKELEASAGSRTIAEIMTDRACVEVCARECSDFLSLSPDRRAHILVEEGDRFGEPGRWRVTGHNWQSYVDKAEETKRP